MVLMPRPRRSPPRERVVLVNVYSGTAADAASELAELAELARSAGGAVVGSLSQRQNRFRRPAEGAPGPFLGDGKLAELADTCKQMGAHVVVTQAGLTPIQLKRMEDRLPCRVVDRTALILDIFAQRAKSREGQLQVELAQALYRLPRLRGHGEELSRLGGGLGTRGPGEQKLEYDRRRIRKRVGLLKREIEKLRHRRGHQRERRHGRSLPAVVLIGYTNAGKTTLFNHLTRSHSEARDHMFSTLDPQVRRLRLPDGGRVLLSDTVGFIRNLPEDLKVAFRATLEEITDADVLLHVVDATHPEAPLHVAAVREELAALGAGSMPVVLVMNKIDALVPNPSNLVPPEGPSVRISARTGEGVGALLACLEEEVRKHFWKRLEWRDPTPQLRAELARMGASVREYPPGDGIPGRLEAWLAPAQISRVAAPGKNGG